MVQEINRLSLVIVYYFLAPKPKRKFSLSQKFPCSGSFFCLPGFPYTYGVLASAFSLCAFKWLHLVVLWKGSNPKQQPFAFKLCNACFCEVSNCSTLHFILWNLLGLAFGDISSPVLLFTSPVVGWRVAILVLWLLVPPTTTLRSHWGYQPVISLTLF